MINEEKIKTMTHLAVYDKKYMAKSRKITGYYPEDYTYIYNFKTRISIFLFLLLCIGIDIAIQINEGLNIPTDTGEIIRLYVVPYGALIIGVLVIYTIISTIRSRKVYQEATHFSKEYQRWLKQLDLYDREQGDTYELKRKYLYAKK